MLFPGFIISFERGIENMDVKLVLDEELNKNKIVINCKEVDSKITRIKNFAEKVDITILGKNNNEKILISPEDIYYIESIDKKTFIYLIDGVWECELRLYELEEVLKGLTLIRISKNCIVNIRKVKKISLMINRNLMLKMDNDEGVIVSRRYVKKFNEFIGMEV